MALPLGMISLDPGVGFPSLCRELAVIPRNLRDPNGYYVMFGLHTWATTAEIKRMYRRLARRLHPDGTDPHPAYFAHVHEAYSVLIDPVLRQLYHSTPEGSLYVDSLVYSQLDPDTLRQVEEGQEEPVTHWGFYFRGEIQERDRETAHLWYQYFMIKHVPDRPGPGTQLRVCLSDNPQVRYRANFGILDVPRLSDEDLSSLSATVRTLVRSSC